MAEDKRMGCESECGRASVEEDEGMRSRASVAEDVGTRSERECGRG